MSIELAKKRITLSGSTMGTRYSAVVFVDPLMDQDGLNQQLHAAVSHVDAVMSNWMDASDISRLNRAPADRWITLPASLMDVLETALRIETLSNGAFDMGVGAAVGAWGFGPYARPGAPQNRASSGMDHRAIAPRSVTREALELDRAGSRARKHAPLCLDLSGIAKGYGVDILGAVLRAADLTHWLVSIDGDVRAGAAKPDGTLWALGLERPTRETRELGGVIEIADIAVATSGTYRHYRDEAGKTLSHTINPATGAPVDGRLASVTVLAPTCMEADAWATAILVDGAWPPKGFEAPGNIDAIVFDHA